MYDFHFDCSIRDINSSGMPKRVTHKPVKGLNRLDAWQRLKTSLRAKGKDLHMVYDVKATRTKITGEIVNVEVQ